MEHPIKNLSFDSSFRVKKRREDRVGVFKVESSNFDKIINHDNVFHGKWNIFLNFPFEEGGIKLFFKVEDKPKIFVKSDECKNEDVKHSVDYNDFLKIYRLSSIFQDVGLGPKIYEPLKVDFEVHDFQENNVYGLFMESLVGKERLNKKEVFEASDQIYYFLKNKKILNHWDDLDSEDYFKNNRRGYLSTDLDQALFNEINPKPSNYFLKTKFQYKNNKGREVKSCFVFLNSKNENNKLKSFGDQNSINYFTLDWSGKNLKESLLRLYEIIKNLIIRTEYDHFYFITDEVEYENYDDIFGDQSFKKGSNIKVYYERNDTVPKVIIVKNTNKIKHSLEDEITFLENNELKNPSILECLKNFFQKNNEVDSKLVCRLNSFK